MSYNGTIGIVNILFNYLPPSLITYIDTREESIGWFTWMQEHQINNVTWIESDLARYNAINKQIQDSALSIKLNMQTIGPITEEASYFSYSVSQENGLTPIHYLQNIWKNIAERSHDRRDVLSLSEVLDIEIEHQWIVIDSLNSLEILNAHLDQLQNVDLIILRALPNIQMEAFEVLTNNLGLMGFKLLGKYGTNFPELMRVIYVRNYPTLYTQTAKQYVDLKSQYQVLSEDLLELQHNYNELEAIKSDVEITQEKLAIVSYEKQQVVEKLKLVTQDLSELQHLHNEVLIKYEQLCERDKLSEQTQQILTTLNDQSKQIATQQFITKSHTNIVAQLENYIALNNYFNTGTKLSNYHGWPISPDIALFIVDAINEKDYDAVIEFGSGTSTELFAKIAQMRQQKNQKTPKILSFDHLTEYYEKTKAILNRENLESFVQLECIPLIPMNLQDTDYQYYDCEQILQAFLRDLPNNAKILVLVDGPPGITCKHARYPALPMIYKSLAQSNSNQLDFVMDDAARLEEKEVVDKWKVYLDQNEYSYLESVPRVCEKGLVLLSVFSD